MAQLNVHHP